MKLHWDYDHRTLDIFMPMYVVKQLAKYGHVTKKRRHTLLQPKPCKYSKEAHILDPPDTSPPANKKETKFVEQVVGSFLYYGRAVDPLILHTLSTITDSQSALTEKNVQMVHNFLDYMVTYPNTTIMYYALDMVLNVHSDASYLTASRVHSCAGGHYFLSSITYPNQPITLNGAIHTLCTILRLVAASAAEAELGALFLNAQQACILRLTLTKLGHPQPHIPLHINNTTTVGIVNNTIKRQRSRAMEMRYFWLLDQKAQKMFNFQYSPGQENLGNYPTKAHNERATIHADPFYVHTKDSPRLLPRAPKPSTWQGCVGVVPNPYLQRTPLPLLRSTRGRANRAQTGLE